MGSLSRVGRVLAPLVVPLFFGTLHHYSIQACPWFVLTGVDCPGCGIVRGCFALVEGDVSGSLRFHPLAPLAFVLGAVGYGRFSWYTLTDRPAALWLPPNTLMFSGTVLLLSVWLARLAGAFGGLPDPVEPANGWVGQVVVPLWGLVVRAAGAR